MSEETFTECPVCGAPFSAPNSWEADHTDTDRLPLYETAVRAVLKAVNEYLPPDSGKSKDWLIGEVIGAVDNPEVFRALNGTTEGDSDTVGKALEDGK